MITFKNFFSFKNNKMFWVNIIAMIVVAVGAVWGTLMWLDAYTRHGESHLVPDVKNQNIENASKVLANKKMRTVIVDSTYVKGAPAGMVLEQTPAAGARVKEGRAIYLTVTTNSVPLVPLPDLIENSSVRQAAAKLKSMGFKLTEPELIPGEQDWIYGIKFRGKALKTGDKIPHEAMLTLCVGNTHLRDSLAMDSTNIELNMNYKSEEEAQVDELWF